MWFPTEKNIEDYRLLKEMLQAQKLEFDLLSKKKLDGQLNKMKIRMVNRVLEPLKKLLENEPSFEFLDILDEVELPTNSDVVLIISQYEAALIEFKKQYYKTDKNLSAGYGRYETRWITKEKPLDYFSTHKK